MISKCPGGVKAIFKELRVRFLIFSKINGLQKGPEKRCRAKIVEKLFDTF